MQRLDIRGEEVNARGCRDMHCITLASKEVRWHAKHKIVLDCMHQIHGQYKRQKCKYDVGMNDVRGHMHHNAKDLTWRR